MPWRLRHNPGISSVPAFVPAVTVLGVQLQFIPSPKLSARLSHWSWTATASGSSPARRPIKRPPYWGRSRSSHIHDPSLKEQLPGSSETPLPNPSSAAQDVAWEALLPSLDVLERKLDKASLSPHDLYDDDLSLTPAEEDYGDTEEMLANKSQSSAIAQEKRLEKLKMKITKERYRQSLRQDINSAWRRKSKWSYDWRDALLKLRQHTQPLKKPISPDTSTVKQTRILIQNPQDVPIPSEWSKQNLTAYIHSLTRIYTPRLARRLLFGTPFPNRLRQARRDVIMHRLLDPYMQPYLSPSACNEALLYLCTHQFGKDARELFNHMRQAGVQVDNQTFQIVMRGAAEVRDLHVFTYLLEKMIQAGLRPDETIWIEFVRTVESRLAKEVIVNVMREEGLLKHPWVVQKIVTHLLPIEVDAFVEKKAALNSLLADLDSQYGPEWMSTWNGTLLCQLLGQEGLLSLSFEVLDEMIRRDCRPGKFALNAFLGLGLRMGDCEFSYRALQRFRDELGIWADERALHVLFFTAWEEMNFNACKVIWRTACIRGHTTTLMRVTVLRSFYRKNKRKTRADRRAGALMLGIDPQRKIKIDHPDFKVTMSTEKALDMVSNSGFLDNSTLSSVLLEVLDADLGACFEYHEAHDFNDLVREALDLDNQWKREETNNLPVYERISRSIHVNFVPGASTYFKPALRQYQFQHLRKELNQELDKALSEMENDDDAH